MAHTAAYHIQQLFQADKVQPDLPARSPFPKHRRQPTLLSRQIRATDRVLPLLNSWGLVGEIQIWRGGLIELPPEESPLLQNLANQTARALERTRSVQIIGNSVPSSPNI